MKMIAYKQGGTWICSLKNHETVTGKIKKEEKQ
jgi:hypothetical protein